MASAERVTARQRAILAAIVESYIDTGEPVGSGTVSRLSQPEIAGLSPATVRNEMAALAEEGLLEQPHTSAGRIPTARAFRMYVGQFDGSGGLSSLSRSEIDSSFAGLTGTHAVLERTSHVLATLTSGVGVAIAAISGVDALEHVHFSRLAESRILAVVVTKAGLVRDRVLTLNRDLTSRELEAAGNFLNENFRGWNIEGVRSEIAKLLDRERNEYQTLLSSVHQLWTQTVPNAEAMRQNQTVYIEGVANLVTGQGGVRQEDRDRLREVLMALETKQRVVDLLNAYIDTRQESVRVVFNIEEQAPEMAGLVLIAAPSRMGGESRGTIGVIGPKRMQYERAMNAVSYISQVFDRMLETSQ
jgi:heat-inducible transcriptional repressor